jgi:hypothetical protein
MFKKKKVITKFEDYMKETLASLEKDNLPKEVKKAFFNQAFGYMDAVQDIYPQFEDEICDLWDDKWHDILYPYTK